MLKYCNVNYDKFLSQVLKNYSSLSLATGDIFEDPQ